MDCQSHLGMHKALNETLAGRKATLIIESKSLCPKQKKDKGRKM
jgi:hypothetical protein